LSVYADTSFLVSLYVPDVNSATAIHQLRAHPVILLTPFAELEMTNALELQLFRKQISGREARAVRHAFVGDVDAGVFHLRPVPEGAYDRARRLSRKHTAQLGTRTGDLLHVAIALEMAAESFLTFDKRQGTLARAEGLTIL